MTPNRVNRAHWPTKENRQNFEFFLIFPAHAKKWAQMGPNGPRRFFFPLIQTLSTFWAARILILRTFIFWSFLGPTFVAWAHLGPAWAHPLGPTHLGPAWAHPLGPSMGQALVDLRYPKASAKHCLRRVKHLMDGLRIQRT